MPATRVCRQSHRKRRKSHENQSDIGDRTRIHGKTPAISGAFHQRDAPHALIQIIFSNCLDLALQAFEKLIEIDKETLVLAADEGRLAVLSRDLEMQPAAFDFNKSSGNGNRPPGRNQREMA